MSDPVPGKAGDGMAAGESAVDRAAMAQAASQAEAAVTVIRGLQTEVASLDAQLRSSLAAWDGNAQQAYFTAKAQWDAAMANMAQVRSQLGAVIGTAHSNYQSAEASNAALWS